MGVDLIFHRGTLHEYLEMRLDYCTQDKVKIYITEYLSKVLGDMQEKQKENAVPLATNYMFEVNNTAKNIIKEDAHILHTIVAKILFLRKWVLPNILTMVVFLTTRARDTDEVTRKTLVVYLNTYRVSCTLY